MEKTKILLAFADAEYNKSMKEFIESTSDMQVVLSVQDGKEAIDGINNYKPDAVILDLFLPKEDGISV
ncbi:MAG: response regulator, partial [Clostridia bacterium]|nr:response regulator [Clostridia bacterium]